jgi:hypothetical protein
VSNLGILLWTTGVVTSAGGAWVARQAGRPSAARFLAAGAGVGSVLLFDDLLQFHARLLPELLGFGKAGGLAVVLAPALAWALRWHHEIARTRWLILVGSLLASVVSLGTDQLLDPQRAGGLHSLHHRRGATRCRRPDRRAGTAGCQAGAVIWQGQAHNHTMLAMGTVIGVAAVVLLAVASPLAALLPAIVALFLVGASRLVVEVDEKRVAIRWGPWRFPVNRIDLDQVLDVQAVAIRPLHAGGWGYRGSRILFSQAAAVVRRGPALQFELQRARVFVVTVDDAPTGATVLQTLLERREAE